MSHVTINSPSSKLVETSKETKTNLKISTSEEKPFVVLHIKGYSQVPLSFNELQKKHLPLIWKYMLDFKMGLHFVSCNAIK